MSFKTGCSKICVVEAPCMKNDVVAEIIDGYTPITIPVLSNDKCGDPLRVVAMSYPDVTDENGVITPLELPAFISTDGTLITFDPRRAGPPDKNPLPLYESTVTFVSELMDTSSFFGLNNDCELILSVGDSLFPRTSFG